MICFTGERDNSTEQSTNGRTEQYTLIGYCNSFAGVGAQYDDWRVKRYCNTADINVWDIRYGRGLTRWVVRKGQTTKKTEIIYYNFKRDNIIMKYTRQRRHSSGGRWTDVSYSCVLFWMKEEGNHFQTQYVYVYVLDDQ